MKNNLEKAKDILYNISDYLIMGAIVLAIGLIIAWRLDILFPQTTAMINTDTPPVKIEKEEDKTPKDTTKSETKDKDKGKDKDQDKEKEKDSEDKKDDEDKDSEAIPDEIPEIINVSIPKGVPSSSIGDILVDKGLVKTTQEFEDMVQKLDLEKSLRSGDFEIEKGSSIETVARIIANKQKE